MATAKKLARHPFLASLIVLLLVAVPGYWRLTVIAANNERTTVAVHEASLRIREVALDVCRAGNSAQRGIRQTFHSTFDTFEELGVTKEATDQLREILPESTEVDADCNLDGVLTSDDYLSRKR